MTAKDYIKDMIELFDGPDYLKYFEQEGKEDIEIHMTDDRELKKSIKQYGGIDKVYQEILRGLRVQKIRKARRR